MKNLIFLVLFAMLGAIGCKQRNPESKKTDISTEEALKEVIVRIDSASNKIENVKKDIESSAEELNNLLNELN